MKERGLKRLMTGAIITFIISLAALILAITKLSVAVDLIASVGTILLLISGIIMTVLLANKFRDRRWFRITIEISTYLLPVFIFLLYLVIDYANSDLLILLGIIVLCEFLLLGIINVFILRDAGESKFIMILLLMIVLSFVFVKISVFQKKLPDFDQILFILLNVSTGCGMLLFGFRCLFQIEKNSYLKTVSFIACLLIAYGSIVFIAKMQFSKVDVLEFIYFVPAFIITLVVLFSLPFSNYIHWSQLHKRIINKILIAWFFFLVIFSTSFIFPDLFKKIAFKETKSTYDFLMNDYELKNKNGLEPD
jgi:hypothetical protein